MTLELSVSRTEMLLQQFQGAIAATSADDLTSWGRRTANVLGEVTLRRGTNFRSLAGKIWDGLSGESKALLKAIRQGKALPHVKARALAARDQAKAFGSNFAALYDAVVTNLHRHPKETAPKLVAGVLGFLVGSGGVDGDGGIPDLDLLGGIGFHRSILTHSVISGIVVETLVVSVLDLSRTVYKNLPEDHDPLWEELNAASEDVFRVLTAGLSAGIAFHLAVDATVDGGGTFKDFPLSVPQVGQQTVLGANAVAEGLNARERVAEKGATEFEGTPFKTFREAADFAKRHPGSVIVRATNGQGFQVRRKPL